MIKKLYLLIALVITAKLASAQKELVTIDEHNKYIFYQVADMPGLTADTMYKRCLAGIKKKDGFKPVGEDGQAITARSKMMLYSNLSYVKHEEGELSYTLHIEFKDAKYRYWLTDFAFTPYQRNRYGVYAKLPGGDTPLEDLKKKDDGKVLDNYLDQIARFGKQTGEEIKVFLTPPLKKDTPPAKTDTRKW